MQKALKRQKSGIKAKKGDNGTLSKEKNLTQKDAIMNLSVNNAVLTTKQNIQELQNTAIQTAKLRHFDKGESCNEEVYDITVEDEHEYFANGVLVHNCMDALRYARMQDKYVGETMVYIFDVSMF
jgi:intein/homing endonuclease